MDPLCQDKKGALKRNSIFSGAPCMGLLLRGDLKIHWCERCKNNETLKGQKDQIGVCALLNSISKP